MWYIVTLKGHSTKNQSSLFIQSLLREAWYFIDQTKRTAIILLVWKANKPRTDIKQVAEQQGATGGSNLEEDDEDKHR